MANQFSLVAKVHLNHHQVLSTSSFLVTMYPKGSCLVIEVSLNLLSLYSKPNHYVDETSVKRPLGLMFSSIAVKVE